MRYLKLQTRRKFGYCIGILILIVIILALISPQTMALHANGPSNIGHENLKCQHCHKEAIGSIRQRLQANVQYLLGRRATAVSFGLKAVSNNECIYCHERPNDRHPVYRFFEPKYKKIQKYIQPQFCVSCHREHTGKRVTSEIIFCKNCHKKLAIKNDPLLTTHKELTHKKDWISCLGCHDYHGNHQMTVNTDYQNKISKLNLEHYFNSAESPYSTLKFYKVAKHKLGKTNEH